MTNYSIVLQDQTHFGSVGDLSLSTGQNFLSMSLWYKATGAPGGGQLCGNQDVQAGTGGWNALIVSGDGGTNQLELDTVNLSYTSPTPQPPDISGAYGLVTGTTDVMDGNWHSIIMTYDGTGVVCTISSIPDSTHFVVDNTAGVSSGDRIWQTFYSTTVTSVVDSTHLQVADTTNFTTTYSYTKGMKIYLDGSLFTMMADYVYSLYGDNYNSTIPFGIGDPQQLAEFTRIGKYAYPALYYSVLSPSNVSFIASGNNLGGAVGQWFFTEGTGLTTVDSSGNGHTLTFNTIDEWSTDVPFIITPPTPVAKQNASSLLIF